MINVDVKSLLLPNPLTMLIQLLATLIIFLAVKKWLWKPVRNILAKRSEAMQASLDSAFSKNEEASKNLEEAKKELEKAKVTSGEIVESAKKEAKVLKQEIVDDAKKQAQAKLDEADNKIENTKLQLQNELHDEIVSVAMSAVEKLLDEKATSSDDKKAIEEFVKEKK